MIVPAVFWPCALGCAFFLAGTFTYRRDVFAGRSRVDAGFLAWGPVFIAASLAAFAGEHFTIARSLVAMVPKWLPARLFIAYLVGVAHLAAALSFVTRRCLRWSTLLLGIMFALFVLLLHLPGAIRNPGLRIAWIVTVRETTFSLGALSFFATTVRNRWPKPSREITAVARVWSGAVIAYYGIDHFLHPQLSPGVPDNTVTASWVPLPHMLAYAVGTLLIVFGIAMVVKKYAASAGKSAGLLMLLLTVGLYVPNFFRAHGVEQHVTGFNFVFDTLLFAGTMLVIARAIVTTESQAESVAQAAL